MTHWKEMVKDALDAIEVVTFDYPYMSGGKRRPPPKADKLVDHHLSVVKNVVAEHPGHPLVLMRKSMGSRVTCMVASSDGIDYCGHMLGLSIEVNSLSQIESQTKEVVPFVLYLCFLQQEAKGVMRDEILLKLMVPTIN
ncbi:hypothetical protein ZWY2020_009188 [Hordeum vulgare]|nr:hypothetical protein ZWY2020_009188 [Hordeum vulgare]